MRTEEAQGELPVSYHGTNLEAAKGIMKIGYKKGHRQLHENLHGKAVYSSPSLDMVAKVYASEFEHNTWKVVLQNRVNPAPGHLCIVEAKESEEGVPPDPIKKRGTITHSG